MSFRLPPAKKKGTPPPAGRMGRRAHARLFSRQGTDLLRQALLVSGVAIGTLAIVAVLALGSAGNTLLADLGRATAEPRGLEIEGPGGVLPAALLDRLQAAVPEARLCPMLEGRGSIDRVPDVEVRVLGLDLIGEARIPATPLSADRLHDVSHRTVLMPAPLCGESGLEPGSSVLITVDGRSAPFVVSKNELPAELSAGSLDPVVVTDVAWFVEAFRPSGGIDRLRVVLSSEAAATEVRAALSPLLPPGARFLVTGGAAEGIWQWVAIWSAAASEIAAAGVLVGAVIVFLALAMTLSRQRARTKDSDGLADRIELAAGGAIGVALGIAAGRVLSAAFLRLCFTSIPPGAANRALPEGTAVPWPSVALVLAIACGLFLVWARVVRPVWVGPADKLSGRRFAAAGLLLTFASMAFFPWRHPALATHLAILCVLAAIGIGAQPVFSAGTALLGRATARRWPLVGRVLATEVREAWGGVGFAIALLVFSAATLGATWVLAEALRAEGAQWIASELAADIRVEAAFPDDQALDRRVAEAMRVRPGTVVTEIREIAATVGGRILPLAVVDAHFIDRLSRGETGAPLPRPRGRGAGTGEDAVPLWVARPHAEEMGLELGSRVDLDTPSGTWPAFVAGIHDPYRGQSACAFVDERAGGHLLSPNAGATALEVTLRGGSSLLAACDEISAAAHPQRLCLVAQRNDRERISQVADAGYRVLLSLLAVLAALGLAVGIGLGPGLVHDAPPGWAVLFALGVPRLRVASAAAIGMAVVSAAALAIAAVVGFLSGSALRMAISPPVRTPALPLEALLGVGLATIVLWVVVAVVGYWVLARRLESWSPPFVEMVR